MLLRRALLPVCLLLVSCFASAAPAEDLLAPSAEAPRYQLSNIRTERDRFGRSLMAIDFRRTKQGKGSVSVGGKSASGRLSISAGVPSQDSGTIRLSNLFSAGRESFGDLEIYFVQSHRLAAGKTLKSMVSNAVRLGNPGEATRTRPWTAQEQAMEKEFERIMNDDSAHKPPKSYPVTTQPPAGSEFVPSTAKLTKGTRLHASYQDKWAPLTTISENDDGTVNVRWDEYGASYDVAMSRGELIIASSLLSGLQKHPDTLFPKTVPNWKTASAKDTLPVSPDAKRRKQYPVSIAVPSDSQFVPKDLKLVAGVPLEACYAGKWNPLTTISENGDGTVNVHWNAYGSSSDCSMVREELIIKKAMAQQLRANPSSFKPTVVPKSRKNYTVSIPVPPDSSFVPPSAVLDQGTKLQACYAGKWNPITFLSHNTDGSLNVRWDDYGPSFDCSMVRKQLIIKKAVLAKTGSSPGAGEMRTYTDATGKFSIKAKIVSQTASQVVLLTEKGKQVTLPLTKLSEADQEFLRSRETAESPFE